MVDRLLQQEQTPNPAEHETIVAEGVSFEDFLATYGDHHSEWLAGKVIFVVSNNTRHQIVLGFLFSFVNLFLGFKPLGKVLLAGVPMYLGDDKPAREPDLMIVLTKNLSRIQSTYVDGAADIVVEVVSPESSIRDRGVKFDEYEAAGVGEYWLIDPLRGEADIYSLGEDGRFHRLPLDEEGRLLSKLLPGFALHPALLWRDEPPNGAELVELAQNLSVK